MLLKSSCVLVQQTKATLLAICTKEKHRAVICSFCARRVCLVSMSVEGSVRSSKYGVFLLKSTHELTAKFNEGVPAMKRELIVHPRMMTNILYEPKAEEIRKLHITVLSRTDVASFGQNYNFKLKNEFDGTHYALASADIAERL